MKLIILDSDEKIRIVKKGLLGFRLLWSRPKARWKWINGLRYKKRDKAN